jgi:hypothetical protein
MSDEQRAQVVEMLARDPECGEVMQGTGGVRKGSRRAAGAWEERRSSCDLLFSQRELPVFALTVFAKNERANLTLAERNAMAAVVRAIKQNLER